MTQTTPSGWRRAKEILSNALEIPDPVERINWVNEHCGADLDLRQSVHHFLKLETQASLIPGSLSTLPVGAIFDPGPRYVVLRLLGAGGLSQVFLARDLQLANRLVVLKTLADPALNSSWIRRKASHEMEALARIRHPNVVQALNFFVAAGDRAVLVLEYVEGRTLRDELQLGAISLPTALDYIQQLASAIDTAHACGVLHRDLKPENVILRPDGNQLKPVLIDFGISKVESATQAQETETVVLAGTTSYMAPEQLMGAASVASDQYALAVLIYEMLLGRRPYYPATPVQLYEMQRKLPRFDGLPLPFRESLQKVLARAMSFDPRHRYANCVEFSNDFAAAARQVPTSLEKATRRRLVFGGAAALTIGASATVAWQPLEDWRDSRAEVPALTGWDGSRDPEEAGFVLRHDLKTRWEPNALRTGYQGYHCYSDTQGQYSLTLSRAHKKALLQRGWRLKCEMAAIEGCTFAILDLKPYGRRFDLYLIAKNGIQVLVLHDGYKPTFRGTEYRLAGPSGALHQLEFFAEPDSKTVRVRVDGEVINTAYSGQPDYQDGYGLIFGTAQYASNKGEGIVGSLSLAIG